MAQIHIPGTSGTAELQPQIGDDVGKDFRLPGCLVIVRRANTHPVPSRRNQRAGGEFLAILLEDMQAHLYLLVGTETNEAEDPTMTLISEHGQFSEVFVERHQDLIF